MNNIVERILGCERGTFPIKYLGIPIKPSKLTKEDWRTLIENFNKKLEG